MDVLTTLGRTLGFSFAAGVNLYATVALLGLASRYGWVSLPPQYQAFDNDWVIGAALVMYAIEFFADKIPYVDSLWDMIHTAIRPIGGALVAVGSAHHPGGAHQHARVDVQPLRPGGLGHVVLCPGHWSRQQRPRQ